MRIKRVVTAMAGCVAVVISAAPWLAAQIPQTAKLSIAIRTSCSA